MKPVIGLLAATIGTEWGNRVRIVGTAVFLTILWLLMSGLYKPIILGLGAGSVLLVVYVIQRMDKVDGDQVDIRLKPLSFFVYIFWLMGEIFKASWSVTKIALSPKIPIEQHFFSVPHTQKTDLGQVIFANSITLTPGTLTVETEPGSFLVHALAYSPNDPQALADMDSKVSAVESVGAG